MFATYPALLLKHQRAEKALRRLNRGWKRTAGLRFLSSAPPRMEKVGTSYGGWYLPVEKIRPDWVVYSGGVGEDISFDLELISRFGVDVFAFDPTPRAVRYVEHAARGIPRFHFSPVGLWSHRRTLKFFAPRDPAHVSHSALNLQGTADFFLAEVRSLGELIAERGHRRIDLLKLDIEGAEYEVLDQLLQSELPVQVLLVEFDQPVPWWRTERMLRRLRAAGYALVCIDQWNFTFVHQT